MLESLASYCRLHSQSGLLIALALCALTILLLLRARWSKLAPLVRCIWISVLIHLALAFAAMTIRFASLEPPKGVHRGPVTLAWFPGDGGISLTSPGGTGGDANAASAIPTVAPEENALTLAEQPFLEQPGENPTQENPAEFPVEAAPATASEPLHVAEPNTNSASNESPAPPFEQPVSDAALSQLTERDPPQAGSPSVDIAASIPQPSPGATSGDTPLANPNATPIAADASTGTDAPVESEALQENQSHDPIAPSAELAESEPTISAAIASSQLPPNDSTDSAGFPRNLPTEDNALVWSPPDPSLQPLRAEKTGSRLQRFSQASAGERNGVNAGSDPQLIYANRASESRSAAAKRFGGSETTEASVAAALDWLASVQSRDGRWDASRYEAGREIMLEGQDRHSAGKTSDSGVTALALLTFLGAGQTHQEGAYIPTVQRGIGYLRLQQNAAGSFAGDANLYEAMYCHAMAVFAMAECYALTKDPAIRPALEAGVAYSLHAQHPTSGGWRYQPWRQMPNDLGDTSLLGWHVMSLRAAERSGITVPAAALQRIDKFLDNVSAGKYGAMARYRPDKGVTPAMTAEALLCRTFLGQSLQPNAQQEASEYLLSNLPGKSEANHYYWYYATLALHQLQGEPWEAWNRELQAELLRTQQTRGALRGSWNPDALWGQYGGRVYSTALCAMCLESYYRYVPRVHYDESVPVQHH